jgi:hypothetical protein
LNSFMGSTHLPHQLGMSIVRFSTCSVTTNNSNSYDKEAAAVAWSADTPISAA